MKIVDTSSGSAHRSDMTELRDRGSEMIGLGL